MLQKRSPALLTILVAIVLGTVAWLFVDGGDHGGDSDPGTPAGSSAPAEQDAASLSAAGGAPAPGSEAARADAKRTEVTPASTPSAASVHLSGRLVSPEGTPLKDVDVGLTLRDRAAPGETAVELAGLPDVLGDGGFDATARSEGSGRFRLQVALGSEGFLRVGGDDWYLRGGEERGVDALRVSPLTEDRDLGDVVLGRAARLGGVIRNEAGKPVAGVRVHVGAGRGMVFGAGLAGETTGADGRFERGGLRPGEYRISTASPDYLPAEAKVSLAEGEARRDLVITVVVGSTIAGVVVDDRGTPLAGIRVGADRSRSLAPGLQVQASSPAEATATDSSGRFVLRGLDAATVNLEAWGAGHARTQVPNVAAGTTDVVIRLLRHGSVAGTLVDGAGAPVAGSEVRARPAGSLEGPLVVNDREAVTTDSEGRFVIEGVRPGATRLVATGDHVRLESDAIDVRPGERTEGVRLAVDRGASLAVVVRDGAGEPVAGARVTVADVPVADATGLVRRAVRVRGGPAGGNPADVRFDDGTERGSATTDAEGVARISGLASGRVVVRATEAKHAPAQSGPVVVPEAGEVRTELTLRAGGFVQLRIADVAGAPVARAHYKLVRDGKDEEGVEPQTGSCDAGGLALVGPLLPGTWRARVVLPAPAVQLGDGMSFMAFGSGGHEFAETEATVEVVGGHTTPLALTQPRLAIVRGTVRDAQGPVARATVEMSHEADQLGLGSPYKATTDSGGRFELRDLPSGKYSLRYGYPDAIVPSETSLAISPGEALVEQDLLLRTGTVRLIVRGEDGEPVADARVTLDRDGAENAPLAPRRQIRMVAMVSRGGEEGTSTTSISAGTPTAKSDAAGEVEITRVPEGEYTVRIEHPRHMDTRKGDVHVLDGATADLGTITMSPGGELRGRVLAADDQPVSLANVEITMLDSGERRTEPAIQGSFRITGLAAGRYRLRATSTGPAPEPLASEPVEVDLGKGERKPVDLRLR